ncbi:MAG: YidC/Oxa1 family membrane protein insertase [Bacilli bacterium]
MSSVFNVGKKHVFVLFAVLSLFTLTSCGVKYEEDSDGKPVVNEQGQRTVINQIDKDSTFKEVYSEDGWFGGLIVYPLVKLITFLGEALSSYGLAIILATLIVRGVALPITLKSSKQQKKMQELNPKVQKVRLKYAGKTDRESQMRMNAEVQKIYKDNNVSMLGGCWGMLITMPIFFGFYSAIYRTPGIFSDPFLGLELDSSPQFQIFDQNHFVYIIPILLVFLFNFLSMRYTQNANKNPKADVKRPYNAASENAPDMMGQQMKMMQYFMPIMMAFISFTLPVGVAVYFIASSLVSVIQTIIIKKV